MTETGSEPVPLRFKIKRVFDAIGDGLTFSRYYHRKAIPDSFARKLIDKLNVRGKLNYKEGGLLLEWERNGLYKKYQRKDMGKILNVASGFDGLPQRAFGEKNIVMLSRNSERYFSQYEQYAHGIMESPKVDVDMQTFPFKDNSFSTVLLNGIDDLNDGLLKEISRTLISGGNFIMTARKISGIDSGFAERVLRYGLKVKENGYGILLRSLVLEKQ